MRGALRQDAGAAQREGGDAGGRTGGLSPPGLTRTPFWFLRHGETDWNAQGRAQGNIDIPLNENGIAQARAAAALMRGHEVGSIVCSDLSRARDTAMMVAEVVGLPVAEDPGLREVSFGGQDGQPMNGAWFAQWVDGLHTPDGAESFAELRQRAVAAINRALTRPAPVLVVAHGALFRALRAEMGLEANIRTPNAVPLWCEPGSPAWTLTPAT